MVFVALGADPEICNVGEAVPMGCECDAAEQDWTVNEWRGCLRWAVHRVALQCGRGNVDKGVFLGVETAFVDAVAVRGGTLVQLSEGRLCTYQSRIAPSFRSVAHSSSEKVMHDVKA